ncbi:Disease resistance protein RPP13 [Dichanthelium oligosanthes]|uniref:Disease resistance protein RPP13 n=1 Tax=Dichanthelium oligosanthes TaxID=888268 RepID=A0A1E5V4W4_9POAL|nr:Disease resistance protein RPP13 [Dichanthelium oligosanthes]
MEFATAALCTLLPKLAQLLQGEFNLQKSARKDIEFLSRELEGAQAALREVGKVPLEQLSEPIRLWAREVREVSYDMEDIIDTFMVRVKGPDPPSESSVKRFFKEMFNIVDFVTKATIRRGIAQEIKDIKQRVKEVAERRDRYRVDAITPANKTLVDPRMTALYTNVTELVGIGESKEDVMMRLTKGNTDQKKRIVSIAGFAGLGKTTLAKVVYDEIQGQFDCAAFVSVSRNPDTKKLLKDMLYELHKGGRGNIHTANLDEIKHLIDLVHEFLQNKRYLIVIDDIWDTEPWKIIGCALIENNMGSRIITTTRIIGVAEQVGGFYRLKPLSGESSEILFYGRIFGSKDKCPVQFLDVSKKILKKCGGVPLAIVTISSLLANKSGDIKEWNDVCDSIGLGLGRNPGMDDMNKILLLSYYDLPPYLKTCLLYLSAFPEDYKIRKDALIWRWIAEGFVQHAGDQSLLEIGESYFNELVNRSLIQPADMDLWDTSPRACRLHDTVLDLISSLSKGECFMTTVLGDGKHSLESKIRWLSLHNNTTRSLTMDMPKLRSLTIFKPAAVIIDSMPCLSRYHLLRVLDLRGCKIKDLASLGFVGSLSHLRFLGLPCDICSAELPVEIGKLRFLQTLDLSETMVRKLPSSIIGLTKLMCLRGGGRFLGTMLPADGLKKLTSLEVLDSVTVKSKCIAEELGHLTQLRVLEVLVVVQDPKGFPAESDDDWRACGEALVESLGTLNKIESLAIRCLCSLHLDGSMETTLGNLCRLEIGGAMVVPTWIRPASLPVLSYLDLRVRYERREDIQILGTLSGLRHLRFHVAYSTGQALERSVVGPDAFPSMVRCEFDLFEPGMVPSMLPRGSMPRLQDYAFGIHLEDFYSGGEFSVDHLALAHLPSLRSAAVRLDRAVNNDEVLRVREKLEHEAVLHPNHPRITVMADLLE